jgi:hypothetical protein
MIIQLRSIAGMRLEIFPDPAIVHVGDRVEWRLLLFPADFPPFSRRRDPFRIGPVKWIVYFRNEQPFGRDRTREMSASASPGEPGSVNFGTAESPGDYKYGVRLIDAQGEQISDDDPFLIVLP